MIIEHFTYKEKTIDVHENGKLFFEGQEIIPINNGNGYMRISIRSKAFYVHRIVCTAFYGNYPIGNKYVNHKDGKRDNNHKDNLHWCSASENLKHSFRELGRVKPAGGSGISGINHAQAKAINKLDRHTLEVLETFGSIRQAAKSVGCKNCSIGDVLKGRWPTCKGFKWTYAEDVKNEFVPRNKKRWEKEQKMRINKAT